jgi:hypothetical protein
MISSWRNVRTRSCDGFFLEKPNATLKQLQDIARAQEAVDEQMKSMGQEGLQFSSAEGLVNIVNAQNKGRGYSGNENLRGGMRSGFQRSGASGGKTGNQNEDYKQGTEQLRRCYNCNRINQ